MEQIYTSFKITLLLLLITTAPSCSQTDDIRSEPIQEQNGNTQKATYLALGDSYTVGESVDFEQSFPAQLDTRIEETKNLNVETTVIAQTGWRTDQLIASIMGRESGNYDLVTLLIGVNNQFQSRPFAQYESEFPELLKKAVQLAGNDSNKVIVLSIPDYFYTPYGQQNGNEQISKALDDYNHFAKVTCTSMGITFLNITDITRNGLNEPELVADDGLHPSSLAYKKFVDRLYPLVSTRLKD
ncbi:Lysophospholipase L1 [Maribacter sedimenticola]|uniref:Lysophospholipase L1 n=1 Tax=Maribacter sedimenticola TaxID=228956 RepID=A0ABY1SLG6_9FLAO|nr:SGNH/GDSL hydrolase family protein [Maribacter sedimenticola]SNR75692.1 Lysophospholipase L1 [Maribacter sedimenticola]